MHIPARTLQVVVGERRDLHAPLAQRRQVQPDDAETVEEVLAEAALADERSRSALVATMRRTSTRLGWVSPIGWISFDSRKRSSLGWTSRLVSPISSRKSVPPAAARMTPWKLSTAPVKAPRRWPNSCESSMSFGVEVQLKGRKAACARVEQA